jgi:hypothetical protein
MSDPIPRERHEYIELDELRIERIISSNDSLAHVPNRGPLPLSDKEHWWGQHRTGRALPNAS